MWFGLIQCNSADSADSVWFNRFRMNQFNSKWFSLIKRDFSCMRRKPRLPMQPNIITYADFRIDKALWKKVQLVIVFHMKLCTPRKRSRTRGCLSQKLFTYGKVNFGELLRCDIPQSRVLRLPAILPGGWLIWSVPPIRCSFCTVDQLARHGWIIYN